jgi:hypothetical protein
MMFPFWLDMSNLHWVSAVMVTLAGLLPWLFGGR